MGLIIGASVVFMFSSLAINAVTRAAGAIVFEVRRQPPAGPPVVDPMLQEPRRRFQLTGVIIGGVALLILAGLLIVGAQTLQSYLSRNNQNGLILIPLPQTVNSTVGPTTVSPTSQPVRPTPLPSPVPNVDTSATAVKGPGSGVALTLNITERTWIRVTVDGTVTYTGSVAPNTTLKYEGSAITFVWRTRLVYMSR